MAETLVKNPTCSKCGEDARPQALFCYACGGEIIGLPEDEKGNVSSAWFKEEIVEVADGRRESSATAAGMQKSESEDSPVIEDDLSSEEELRSETELVSEKEDAEPEPDESGEENAEGKVDEEVPKLEKVEETGSSELPRVRRRYVADRSSDKRVKLRTASDLKNRPKSVHAKRVELVWEEKSDSPNVLFLVVGFLIATIAGVLFFLAYVLK